MVTIKSRIKFSVVIMLLAIFGIVGMNYLNLREMAHMQDVGAKRALAAVDIKEASMGGMALYHIISDAMINRNLNKTAKVWDDKKAEVLTNFDRVIEAIDTKEEKKQAEEIKSAIREIVSIFEVKTLTALKSTDGTSAEIWELHDRINVQVNKVESGMDRLVLSLQSKMIDSDKEFGAVIRKTITQSIIIGLIGILLQVWLAGWLLRKKMDNRIEELETTKARVMRLEGLIPICMYCKKIRDDQNIWHQLEKYFAEHSLTMFTHGMCPECFDNHMEEMQKEFPMDT